MSLYSRHDLDEPGNDGQTLRQHIRSSESRFGLERTNLGSMTDEKLTTYVEWLDHLDNTGWHDGLEDRRSW